MSDIEAMRESIHDLYSLVAQERLRNDANSQEPSAKLGIFVDPFFDDDMRDQGMEQTAAIVDGELTLPIAADIAETGRESDAFILSYELEPVREQLLRTTDMKINPYQAFEPVPAKVTLNLAVDRWTEVNTSWSSPITRRFSQFTSPRTRTSIVGSGNRSVVQSRTTSNVLLRVQRIEGFDPGEELETLLFDGIKIKPLEA